ncbi:MAG: hypothetical protein SNJ82_02695, partial [Gemmataceae bacterium]
MMRSLFLTGGFLLAAVLTPAVRADDDDLRLRLPGTTPAKPADTRTLGLTAEDDDAEVMETRYRRGFVGFYGGFYRPIYYGGFYRPIYYGGFYRPIYYGGFYRGVGFGFGYPAFYGG